MKCGVVVFPGSNCDHDIYHVLKHVMQQDATFLWHQDDTLQGCELVVLPGGFAYGDYLRAGAMAALSPVMGAVKRHAEAGGLVLGICNGFQVLLEDVLQDVVDVMVSVAAGEDDDAAPHGLAPGSPRISTE